MEESDPRGLGDLTLRLASESEGRAEVGPLSGAQEQSSVALYGRFPSPAPRKRLIGVIRLGFFISTKTL